MNRTNYSLLTIANQLDDKYNQDGDGEHPDYTREQWRNAVYTQKTLLGYWMWVADNI